MKKVKLKEILKRNKEIIPIDKNKKYEQVTIRMWNRGIKRRGTISGEEILGKRYVVKSGQFIISKIDARHAAFGIIPEELDKAVITADFLSYDLDVKQIHSPYFDLFTKTPVFFEECEKASSGTTNRIRLNEDKFLNIEITLPSLEEQKRVIAAVNKFHYHEKEIRELNSSNESLIVRLRQQILQSAVQGKLVPQNPGDEPASELLKKIQKEKEKLIKEGKIKRGKDLPAIGKDEIPYDLPKGWVWCRLGEITNFGTSEKADSRKIYPSTWILDLEDIEKDSSRLLKKLRFRERNSLSTKSIFYKNDVLYGKLRPYLDKVIVADENGVCTTEILPIRAYAFLSPYYLRICLKSPSFISYVNSKVYGMKMPRLGTEDGRRALIPLPPLSEQKRIVEKVDRLMAYCDELEKQVKENQINSKRLMSAVLSEAFK